MTELLRRAVLVAGLFAGAWLYFLTLPWLLQVERVDFATRYDQEYRQRRESSPPGVYERGRKPAAGLSDPGSVDASIARQTENRPLRVEGPE